MGAVNPSKMPRKKTIQRKDNPDAVEFYAKGGRVRKFNGTEGSEVKSGTVVKEGADIPRYKNQMYWEEPSFVQKRMIDAKELAGDAGEAIANMVDIYGIKRKQEEARLRAADKKAKGGKVWDKPRPKDLGKPKKMSSAKKASAKAMAKAAGRPYPNLIDNMRAARKKK
jgi:hypothetical protein